MATHHPDTARMVQEEFTSASASINNSCEGSISSDCTESNEKHKEKAKKREENVEQIEEKVKKESGRIVLFRAILVLSMLSVGAALSALTYYILHEGFIEDAEQSFVSFANGIEDSFRVAVYDIFEANRALSQSIAVSAIEHGGNFPFFAVPYFEAKAHAARKQASFEKVVYAPVVSGVQVEAYLEFANATRSWYDESKTVYDELSPEESNRSAEPPTKPLPPTLWEIQSDGGMVMAEKSSAIVVSSLHTSPPPPLGKIHQNVNLWSSEHYREVTLASLTLKDAVFSKFNNIYTGYSTTTQDSLDEKGTLLRPYSIAAQPIFNRLRAAEATSSTQALKVVGYIYSVINWANYLKNLLPEGVNGVIVILRNSCGQEFTFRLDGNQALFLGVGNLHEGTSLDGLMKTIDFADNYFDPELTSLQPGHCQIFLDVYASAEFLQAYESPLPLVFCITVAVLFVLMAALFSLYDMSVRVRNRKVVDTAARTNAVMSSLFPANVRDRLIEDYTGFEESDHMGKQNISSFLSGSGSEPTAAPSESRSRADARPLADFFPNTTVMFADIVGFTNFSSSRQPWEVFTLLETIYGAFDRVARRQKVYKVETIGDCYVAATGLPESCEDHAVAMAIFARTILKRMNVIVHKLSGELGPDTRDLTLRIGIHSGPVTAGVLRGERSRFQLFGDTMNTASRMESNSMPRRIQVSQATADLLIEAGKQSWLRQREDKIQAKGKGQLTTFWLEASDIKGSTSQASSSISDQCSGHHTDLDDDDNYKTLPEEDCLPSVNDELSTRLFDRLSKARRTSGRGVRGAEDDGECDQEIMENTNHPSNTTERLGTSHNSF